MKIIAESQQEFDDLINAFKYLHDFKVEIRSFNWKFWQWFYLDNETYHWKCDIWNYHHECLDQDIPMIGTLVHLYCISFMEDENPEYYKWLKEHFILNLEI